MDKTLTISQLMQASGVKFGTNGARGLVEAMSDEVCYAYTLAFLQYMTQQGLLHRNGPVAIAGDFRHSTTRILTALHQAISDHGCTTVHCGRIPSPALALYGIKRGLPTLMVTGSHIPDDRNGIKFTTPKGEISKEDEQAIRQQSVSITTALFTSAGRFNNAPALPEINEEAYRQYQARYRDFFPKSALAGLSIGVYAHSTVAAKPLLDLLDHLGAKTTELAPSEQFVPVDTEAIRGEDIRLAHQWSQQYQFDAIVSADGDGDRPLISDESGNWIRGDIIGILCAQHLGIRAIVTPVSSNTAVEKCGHFDLVSRTRIGSPFVIEGMLTALQNGHHNVAGYEANGGVLLASNISRNNCSLESLPTRDAVLPILCLLEMAKTKNIPLSKLVTTLPARYTCSDRLKNFPTQKSQKCIEQLYSGDFVLDQNSIEKTFGQLAGKLNLIDVTDGLRMTFDNQDIIHLRPSGNAPEFRCYTEAATEERAQTLNQECMNLLESWRE